jgi:hypothetical protein
MSKKNISPEELERGIAAMQAHAANTRSWANIAYEEDAAAAAAQARRNAALTPAQRAARNAKRAAAAAAEETARAKAVRNMEAARTRRNREMANRQAARNAERDAKRGSRRNEGRPPVHTAFRGIAAAAPAAAAPAVRAPAAAGPRLPPGKMARECKSSDVAHAHPTGGPCKFMHKDEAGFELLRDEQKREGPPKGGRRTRKRSTRRS